MIFDVLDGGPEQLVVVADEDEAVTAAGFGGVERIIALAPAGQQPVPGDLPAVRAEWDAYLAGDVFALDRVLVRQAGSPLRAEVWDALRRVPPGHPISYGELAEVIGRPRAARAVGSACGANHVAPFVPCHRVIAADGSLGGYGYGLPIKKWLLEHEANAATAAISKPQSVTCGTSC